jgi:hypothetical protein
MDHVRKAAVHSGERSQEGNMNLNTTTSPPAALVSTFQRLAKQWRTETGFLSSTSAIVAHPAYQAIIALGPPVVPLILQELEKEPAYWFEALRAIAREDPAAGEARGNFRALAAAWLDWGRARGLLGEAAKP